jgi:hypothetical protein
MSAQRITSTPKNRIQSLSCQGTRVAEHYFQIKELIRTRLGDEYALLFAEPDGLRGDVIDWYTPLQGPIFAVAELPEDESRKILSLAGQLAGGVKRLACELKENGASPTNVLRGMTLELALRYPDISCIYAVGGHPVITCWGFSSAGKGAQPEDLARVGECLAPSAQSPAHQPIQAPTLTPEAQNSRSGLAAWLWLIPLLLLLLAILFIPFGEWQPIIRLPGLDFRLPALPWASRDTPIPAQITDAEENRLQADIDRIREKLSAQAAVCLPQQRQDSPPDAAPRQDLVIPEKPNDYAFLQGKWMNDAGLISRLDGQPITVIYVFDSTGNGSVTVRQAGKKDCVGKAEAHFTEPGVLRIEAENQTCPGENKSYKAEVIECRQAAGVQASCLGKSGDGASWGGNVYFRRIP